MLSNHMTTGCDQPGVRQIYHQGKRAEKITFCGQAVTAGTLEAAQPYEHKAGDALHGKVSGNMLTISNSNSFSWAPDLVLPGRDFEPPIFRKLGPGLKRR
jgi:hypothetical protein